jgi:hypothetical protein
MSQPGLYLVEILECLLGLGNINFANQKKQPARVVPKTLQANVLLKKRYYFYEIALEQLFF